MADDRDTFFHGIFPEGFKWSTATASYQIEGAVDEGGRSKSIWDTFSHSKGKTLHGDTGNVACDSYHKYEEDIQLMKNLGTTFYRFSLAWCRIIPDPFTKIVNQEGVDFYNRVIDALLAAGIQPFITLYHWDLPQSLQDIGGWTNPKLVNYFSDYANVCFEKFGDRVKHWLTFNEPICSVWLGYGNGEHAPGIKDPTKSTFLAAHTIILSHSRAYHIYNDQYKPKQNGQLGITLNCDWCEPKDRSNPSDCEAAEKIMQFKLGWYANPIFGNGDYPEILKAQLRKKAADLGLPESPLPEFTEAEKKQNKGTYDYFGLNHYTTRLISALSLPVPPESEGAMMDCKEEVDPKWKRAESCWLYVVPWGLRRLLVWIKEQYGNPPLYVTENGFSDKEGTEDTDRVDYYRNYINEVLKAIRLDGCDVRGYTAWSLLDNFEWARGYSERFGLHYVDFNDPERKRTPKESAKFYGEVIRNNGFPA